MSINEQLVALVAIFVAGTFVSLFATNPTFRRNILAVAPSQPLMWPNRRLRPIVGAIFAAMAMAVAFAIQSFHN